MAQPKFSVITPSFNQGRYIRTTIESVLAQQWENFEHIVIDGGSTDETIEILKSFPHLKWRSEKDRGQADALNKGFADATGDIIAWINSDDWYAPGVFAEVATALKDYPIVMGACQLTDEAGRPELSVPNNQRSWFDVLKYWVPYSIPTQPAIFFRRDLLVEARREDGLFVDPNLHYVMDYDLWLRMGRFYPLAKRIDQVLAFYRMTPTNKTGDAQGGMKVIEPELSAVFKRHEALGTDPKNPLTVVTPRERHYISQAINLARGRIVFFSEFDDAARHPTISELQPHFDRDSVGAVLLHSGVAFRRSALNELSNTSGCLQKIETHLEIPHLLTERAWEVVTA